MSSTREDATGESIQTDDMEYLPAMPPEAALRAVRKVHDALFGDADSRRR